MTGNVTLRQLRAFVAVARSRSFTQAANELSLTQSAVTMAIRTLEAEVGLRLLDRSTRHVAPTTHGERFLATAERMLEDMERALEDLRAIAEREQGLVVVAATASFINYVLAPALRDLSLRFPGISVRLIEEHTEGAARRLLAAEVDFAVTTLPSPEHGIEAVPLLRDRFAVICPEGHPLTRAGASLGWGALLDFPRAGLSIQNGIRRLLQQDKHGIQAVRDLRYEVSSVGALQSIVETGLAIAVMPALAAVPMQRSPLVCRVLEPPLYRTVSLARRAGRSLTPAATEVVRAAIKRLQHLRNADIEVLWDEVALRRQRWIHEARGKD
ncbi:LysR family transcriptional regulator [Sabulicella glaciei]|uniref:LysR family transcriptional regulator n=1 Tax=Sabulicella glaciei TaxID=2984948 RepID=A0ABT3P1Z8_9PROT|nr:LysR family transcriptional regulator [Roseococcus sp. MDT2-1-1]MCW8088416.1 LysR family transcriptional regulator [Roseococcus sp. MDT2-1-1]